MDFDKEIEQHTLWRAMVESLFNKSAKDFALTSVISDDHHCQLGKWLHSKDSEPYSNNAVFESLCEVHKEFHLTAGAILSSFKRNDVDKALALESKFYLLSEEVINCLNELKSV